MSRYLAITLRNTWYSMEKVSYVIPSKVSPNKVCGYIRSAYLDGKTRLSSYAENIDPNVYKAQYRYRFELIDKLERRDDFDDLKTMVMEEDQKDMFIRSASAQRKAFDLLMSTIEAAQQSVSESPADPKTLQAATTVLKTLAPAFQAINQEPDDNRRRVVDRKARAAKVISGGSL